LSGPGLSSVELLLRASHLSARLRSPQNSWHKHRPCGRRQTSDLLFRYDRKSRRVQSKSQREGEGPRIRGQPEHSRGVGIRRIISAQCGRFRGLRLNDRMLTLARSLLRDRRTGAPRYVAHLVHQFRKIVGGLTLTPLAFQLLDLERRSLPEHPILGTVHSNREVGHEYHASSSAYRP
jgi:hypothetical protein